MVRQKWLVDPNRCISGIGGQSPFTLIPASCQLAEVAAKGLVLQEHEELAPSMHLGLCEGPCNLGKPVPLRGRDNLRTVGGVEAYEKGLELFRVVDIFDRV